MRDNPPKLVRFLSEQYQNYGCINGDSNGTSKSNAITFKILKKNFFRQISAEVYPSERKTQLVTGVSQWPIFIRLTSVTADEKIIPESLSPSPHIIIEMGMTCREMKSGSQRFRWNLLFNVLLWIIVPLPIWISFVSNQIALYLIPSIQAVFVLMWTGKKIK
jgi:hypothetical protein